MLDHKRDWRLFQKRVVRILDADSGELCDTRTLVETVTADMVMTGIADIVVIPVYDLDLPIAETDVTSGKSRRPYPHTVGSIERLIKDTPYQGYPVVENKQSLILVGFIRRTDIQWAIDRARRKFSIEDDCPCFFADFDGQETGDPPQLFSPDSQTLHQASSTLSLHLSVTINPTLMEYGQFKTHINFKPWIEGTPLTVPPHAPMDVVFIMFKQLGVRCLLVIREGISVLLDDSEISDDTKKLYEKISNSSGEALLSSVWPPPGALEGIITKKG